VAGEAVVREIESALQPEEACARFLDLPFCLFLDSASHPAQLGRYSFVAADPFRVLRSRHGETDPLPALQDVLAGYPMETIPGLPPFQGGAAGYFAYDLCHHLERLPTPRPDDLRLPELCVGMYDWVLAWDHQERRTWLVSSGLPARGAPERAARARERAEWVQRRLAAAPARRRPRSAGPPTPAAGDSPRRFPVAGVPGVLSTFSRDGYLRAVGRTREYILAGDIFQANLSHRLEAEVRQDPWQLYRRLRRRNAAPFAAYFDIGEAAILSSSPERFLRLEEDRVETRPIKGTRPRGSTPLHDAALREALQTSEKDRAENVMIVDLLRNDLSVVCADGSVEVPQLLATESYAEVHHLVSVVTGRLRPGLGAVDLLRAAFPGGSITGAPKVRAMEIIAELEPTRRGVYTGTLGYIGFDGTMDSSIVIRTFVVKNGRAYFQVGGGIVADSAPEHEYLETLDKARGLLAALEEHDGPADR
jgi:para-aminobenzoate synthetase component 1